MADALLEPLLAALVLLMLSRMLRHRLGRDMPVAVPAIAAPPASVTEGAWQRARQHHRRSSPGG